MYILLYFLYVLHPVQKVQIYRASTYVQYVLPLSCRVLYVYIVITCATIHPKKIVKDKNKNKIKIKIKKSQKRIQLPRKKKTNDFFFYRSVISRLTNRWAVSTQIKFTFQTWIYPSPLFTCPGFFFFLSLFYLLLVGPKKVKKDSDLEICLGFALGDHK